MPLVTIPTGGASLDVTPMTPRAPGHPEISPTPPEVLKAISEWQELESASIQHAEDRMSDAVANQSEHPFWGKSIITQEVTEDLCIWAPGLSKTTVDRPSWVGTNSTTCVCTCSRGGGESNVITMGATGRPAERRQGNLYYVSPGPSSAAMSVHWHANEGRRPGLITRAG